MKAFYIPVTYEMSGRMVVFAETEEEARRLAEANYYDDIINEDRISTFTFNFDRIESEEVGE